MDKNRIKAASCLISPERISRLKVQGYSSVFSDEEISEHSVGNRFAFQLCTVLFVAGLVSTNIQILLVASIIAMLGGILLTVALLVSILDFCIPSIIYNYLFTNRNDKT